MSRVSRSCVLCLSCLIVRLQLNRRMLVPTPKGPHLPAFCDFFHPSSSPSSLSLACFLPTLHSPSGGCELTMCELTVLLMQSKRGTTRRVAAGEGGTRGGAQHDRCVILLGRLGYVSRELVWSQHLWLGSHYYHGNVAVLIHYSTNGQLS